jgi:hypothetical protein
MVCNVGNVNGVPTGCGDHRNPLGNTSRVIASGNERIIDDNRVTFQFANE